MLWDVGMTQAWKLICLVFLSAAVVGCGAKPVTVTGNEDLVQQAVTESLQAWKDGKDPAEFTVPIRRWLSLTKTGKGGRSCWILHCPKSRRSTEAIGGRKLS